MKEIFELWQKQGVRQLEEGISPDSSEDEREYKRYKKRMAEAADSVILSSSGCTAITRRLQRPWHKSVFARRETPAQVPPEAVRLFDETMKNDAPAPVDLPPLPQSPRG